MKCGSRARARWSPHGKEAACLQELHHSECKGSPYGVNHRRQDKEKLREAGVLQGNLDLGKRVDSTLDSGARIHGHNGWEVNVLFELLLQVLVIDLATDL